MPHMAFSVNLEVLLSGHPSLFEIFLGETKGFFVSMVHFAPRLTAQRNPAFRFFLTCCFNSSSKASDWPKGQNDEVEQGPPKWLSVRTVRRLPSSAPEKRRPIRRNFLLVNQGA